MDKQPIELQAKLDEATSKNNINADIAKLEKNLDKVELQVEIDPNTSGSIKREVEKQSGSLQKLLTIVSNLINKLNALATIQIGANTLFNTGKSNRFCPLWG